ncbi:MAG: hypothetical protein Q7R32_02770 [Dehalococcoidia bacterium]|nr:hypothetical protein [Dehalococcoidia bacterium]
MSETARQITSQYAGTTINSGCRADYDCAPIGAGCPGALWACEDSARTWDTGCHVPARSAATEAADDAAHVAAVAAVTAVYAAILAAREEIAGQPVGLGTDTDADRRAAAWGFVRIGDCLSIPAGPLAGIWEVWSTWGHGPLDRPLTQHPYLASLTRPGERCQATHEELAAWGATYCARPEVEPGRCAAAGPEGTSRCWLQAVEGSPYCRNHTPCPTCGALRGPVPHHANHACRGSLRPAALRGDRLMTKSITHARHGDWLRIPDAGTAPVRVVATYPAGVVVALAEGEQRFEYTDLERDGAEYATSPTDTLLAAAAEDAADAAWDAADAVWEATEAAEAAREAREAAADGGESTDPLIAAAPELLGFLRGIIRMAGPCRECHGSGRWLTHACSYCGGCGESCEIGTELPDLRALIASAEGRQP